MSSEQHHSESFSKVLTSQLTNEALEKFQAVQNHGKLEGFGNMVSHVFVDKVKKIHDRHEIQNEIHTILGEWIEDHGHFTDHLDKHDLCNEKVKQLSEELKKEKDNAKETQVYIEKLISLFTTGDTAKDTVHIQEIVLTLDNLTNQSQTELKEMLLKLRKKFFHEFQKQVKSQVKKEESKIEKVVNQKSKRLLAVEEEVKKELAKKVFKKGIITEKLLKFSFESASDAVKAAHLAGTTLLAASNIVSKMSYGFAAVAFLAKTALDYKKLQNQEITQNQFIQNTKYNGVDAIGGLAGATIGAVAGAYLGSALPILGTLAGALAGSIAGCFLGSYTFKAMLEMIEQRMENLKKSMENDKQDIMENKNDFKDKWQHIEMISQESYFNQQEIFNQQLIHNLLLIINSKTQAAQEYRQIIQECIIFERRNRALKKDRAEFEQKIEREKIQDAVQTNLKKRYQNTKKELLDAVNEHVNKHIFIWLKELEEKQAAEESLKNQGLEHSKKEVGQSQQDNNFNLLKQRQNQTLKIAIEKNIEQDLWPLIKQLQKLQVKEEKKMIAETEKMVGIKHSVDNNIKNYWIDAVESHIKYHLSDLKNKVKESLEMQEFIEVLLEDLKKKVWQEKERFKEPERSTLSQWAKKKLVSVGDYLFS